MNRRRYLQLLFGDIDNGNTNLRSYATWDPANKGANIALSGGNLSETGGNGSVRSTKGKSAGKWYWETTLNAGSIANKVAGIQSASGDLAQYTGADAFGFSFYPEGPNKVNVSLFTAYGTKGAGGDIIGIALDMDNGKVFFARNGVWQNSADPTLGTNAAFTGLSGTYFASNGATVAGQGSVTNFGASAFTYGPPVGYNRGLF